MRRRTEVDALRGLMLVWMTLTHLPTPISVYSSQAIGFLSSAEGFIFLSALFTGLIYFRTVLREGYGEMRLRLWGRTLKIYGYHMLMIGLAFVFAPLIAGPSHPGLHNLLDFYFSAGFRRATVDAAVLVYRPPLLDILPMYVIFMGLSPLLITVARRVTWKPVLMGSTLFWMAAQIGMREAAYNWLGHVGLQIPLNEMGAFDLWAWQLVWVFGLWCGVRWAQDDFPIGKWARKITLPAGLIVVSLVCLRYSLNYGVDLGRFEPAFDKWHLGIVRIVEFVCVGALLVRFQAQVKPLALRPLVIMGQSSLAVFCTHLPFCFLGLILMRDNPVVMGWEQAALPAVTLFAQYMAARYAVQRKAKSRAAAPAISLTPLASR
jgi:hypothetical protein